jgi:3-methyladenine DNA glycosylase Tag
MQQIPATPDESDAFSKDLKRCGFRFVGSTVVYAHMQAVGMVNDHLVDCFRYRGDSAEFEGWIFHIMKSVEMARKSSWVY